MSLAASQYQDLIKAVHTFYMYNLSLNTSRKETLTHERLKVDSNARFFSLSSVLEIPSVRFFWFFHNNANYLMSLSNLCLEICLAHLLYITSILSMISFHIAIMTFF